MSDANPTFLARALTVYNSHVRNRCREVADFLLNGENVHLIALQRLTLRQGKVDTVRRYDIKASRVGKLDALRLCVLGDSLQRCQGECYCDNCFFHCVCLGAGYRPAFGTRMRRFLVWYSGNERAYLQSEEDLPGLLGL